MSKGLRKRGMTTLVIDESSSAAYLELTMRLGLPLGSKDEPLRKAAGKVGVGVLPVG